MPQIGEATGRGIIRPSWSKKKSTTISRVRVTDPVPRTGYLTPSGFVHLPTGRVTSTTTTTGKIISTVVGGQTPTYSSLSKSQKRAVLTKLKRDPNWDRGPNIMLGARRDKIIKAYMEKTYGTPTPTKAPTPSVGDSWEDITVVSGPPTTVTPGGVIVGGPGTIGVGGEPVITYDKGAKPAPRIIKPKIKPKPAPRIIKPPIITKAPVTGVSFSDLTGEKFAKALEAPSPIITKAKAPIITKAPLPRERKIAGMSLATSFFDVQIDQKTGELFLAPERKALRPPRLPKKREVFVGGVTFKVPETTTAYDISQMVVKGELTPETVSFADRPKGIVTQEKSLEQRIYDYSTKVQKSLGIEQLKTKPGEREVWSQQVLMQQEFKETKRLLTPIIGPFGFIVGGFVRGATGIGIMGVSAALQLKARKERFALGVERIIEGEPPIDVIKEVSKREASLMATGTALTATVMARGVKQKIERFKEKPAVTALETVGEIAAFKVAIGGVMAGLEKVIPESTVYAGQVIGVGDPGLMAKSFAAMDITPAAVPSFVTDIVPSGVVPLAIFASVTPTAAVISLGGVPLALGLEEVIKTRPAEVGFGLRKAILKAAPEPMLPIKPITIIKGKPIKLDEIPIELPIIFAEPTVSQLFLKPIKMVEKIPTELEGIVSFEFVEPKLPGERLTPKELKKIIEPEFKIPYEVARPTTIGKVTEITPPRKQAFEIVLPKVLKKDVLKDFKVDMKPPEMMMTKRDIKIFDKAAQLRLKKLYETGVIPRPTSPEEMFGAKPTRGSLLLMERDIFGGLEKETTKIIPTVEERFRASLSPFGTWDKSITGQMKGFAEAGAFPPLKGLSVFKPMEGKPSIDPFGGKAVVSPRLKEFGIDYTLLAGITRITDPIPRTGYLTPSGFVHLPTGRLTTGKIISTVVGGRPSTKIQPPILDVKQPPILDVTQPPILDVTQPPILDVTQPPILDVTQPPILDVTQPPILDVTQPPAQIQMPILDTPQPPILDVTQPPITDITTPVKFKPMPIEKALPVFFSPPKDRKKKKVVGLFDMEPGYNTFIKSQGKHKRANVEPLTRMDAVALGMSKTDNYPAASFKILKSGENASRPTRNANIFKMLDHKFYKKGTNRWIERTSFRIDNMGEIQGIPFEAVRLRKAGLLKTKPRKKKQTKKTTKGMKKRSNKREHTMFEMVGV